MKGLVALACLMMLAPASAELVWGPVEGDGMAVVGLGAVEDGQLLSHQNMEMQVTSPGLGFHSQTLHDHDAFFWFASEPTVDGETLLAAEGPAGSAMATVPVAADGSSSVSTSDENGLVSIETDSHVYWWVTDAQGDLMAAAHVAPGDDLPVFRWEGAQDWQFYTLGGGTQGEGTYSHQTSEDLLAPVTSLLEDEEPAAAPCMGLLQEPAGDWYEDTHVRVSWRPADALRGSGDPLEVRYTVIGTDGPLGFAATRDPYGHALLRVPEAGTYTLRVDAGGDVCDQPFNVLPSNGSTPPIWDVVAREGGFDVSFTADTTAHYDVDAIVTDLQGLRLTYAGKLHSHGGGVKGSFDVPPGAYEVALFAVAQGEGPTISEPMVTTVTVVAVPVESDAATPAVGPALFAVALLAVALRRRSLE